jgi:histidyl-tRNA synthetase
MIHSDSPEVGSVCSGGRFDDLAGLYTKTQLPGVGISIGLTRLFYKLREAGIIEANRQSPADVVVLPLTPSQIGYGLEISDMLRQSGIAVLHYTEPNNVKAKFKYADRMGYRYALVLGENEAKDGTVSVKDMASGESIVVEKQDLLETLSKES